MYDKTATNLLLLVVTCTLLIVPSWACSNVLITPAASSDGNAMIGDNDDSAKRMGGVTHFSAGEWKSGATRAIYDFETSVYRGEVAQPSTTFNVMGGANEMGVVIAESTFGGIDELSGGDNKILDYGSLITTTLQRAGTAREAIKTMASLTGEYGYSSSGEGFSITDGNEVWHMEIIGRGEWGMGILYVAMRLPDGYISAHANQARITQYLEACEDPEWCMASPDNLQFAIDRGYYNGTAADFSFSDVYDPVTVSGARFCEARVWYMFSMLADPADFDAAQYLDYAQGFNLTNRMPLFVKGKVDGINRQEVHNMMSAHFQNSWFDPSLDVGAGAEHSPYRWNGLSWSTEDGESYVNERVVGTQATAWHFVAVVDPKEPAPMRALSWFGVDDHTWAPKVPLYGGATEVHRSYDDGNCSARVACRQELELPGVMMQFSWESGFWVNSAVAQLVYGSVDRAGPIVTNARCALETYLEPKVAAAAADARASFEAGNMASGVSTLTSLAVESTAYAHSQWSLLFQQLMVATMDGYDTVANPDNLMCGCTKHTAVFNTTWLAKVVADTGDHYRYPGEACDYIDADGHCHSFDEQLTASRDVNVAKSIPKYLVRGVVP